MPGYSVTGLGWGLLSAVFKALQVIPVCSQVGADEILSSILLAPYSNRMACLSLSGRLWVLIIKSQGSLGQR